MRTRTPARQRAKPVPPRRVSDTTLALNSKFVPAFLVALTDKGHMARDVTEVRFIPPPAGTEKPGMTVVIMSEGEQFKRFVTFEELEAGSENPGRYIDMLMDEEAARQRSLHPAVIDATPAPVALGASITHVIVDDPAPTAPSVEGDAPKGDTN